jgi:hypothetical protein
MRGGVSRLLIGSLIAASSSGCTHHRILSLQPTLAEAAAFNGRVAERRATVRMRGDGSEAIGTLTLSGASLTLPPLVRGGAIPLHEVDRIRYTSRARGAWDGFLLGALPGLGVGVLGALFDDYSCSGCDGAGYAIAIGGMLGLTGGGDRSDHRRVDRRPLRVLRGRAGAGAGESSLGRLRPRGLRPAPATRRPERFIVAHVGRHLEVMSSGREMVPAAEISRHAFAESPRTRARVATDARSRAPDDQPGGRTDRSW